MFTGEQNVTQTACAGPRETKKSFKGVENFLRRVAYNLGNSPSQTEVKIISCIPIDVTDLQDRILLLEKELEAAKQQYQPHNTKEIALPATTSIVHSDYNNQLHNPSAPYSELEDNIKEPSIDFQQPTTVGYITPKKRTFAMTNTEYADFPVYNKNSFFHKKKRQLKKKLQNYQKTNFIFHAQTEGGPFQRKYNNVSRNVNAKGNIQAYVNEYELPMLKTNRFSSPVLKDNCPRGQSCYDSDLCSCCRGKFQNIDEHMTKPHCSLIDPLLTIAGEDYVNNRGNYYDSKLYDLVPVKEKTIKHKKDISGNKRNEFQELIDMLCYPEQMRPKSAVRQREYVVNYQTVTPNRFANRHKSDRKLLPKRRLGPNYLDKQNSSNASKYCYVSCGNVYAKRPTQRVYKYGTINSLPRKNVNCFSSRSNLLRRSKNTECQTIIEKSASAQEPKSPKEKENKTEETLNQIKTILQTVLQEVKTNSECKNKKDAVIQKETSQNKDLGSNVLNSFTYSAYNSIPSANYIPQAPTNYFYPHNLQDPRLTCQNYPVFVPGAAHHMCNTQCKQPHEMENKHEKAKTSSKLMQQKRSTETNKLIKEIYKSLALSMDNTATLGGLEKRNEGFDKTANDNVPKAREVKTEPVNVRSYVTNMTVNTRSVTKDTIPHFSETFHTKSLSKNTDGERSEKFNKLTASKSTDQSTSTETLTMKHSVIERSVDDEEDSETSSNSEESVTTTTQTYTTKSHQTQKKETGIFRRVFNMFKKSKTNASTKTEETVSDSESDYQTIYKEPVTRPNPTIHFNYPPKHLRKSRNHSKIFSSRSRICQQVKKKDKRILRNHDRLHFNEHQYGHYQGVRKPVYRQAFDARSAICDYDYKTKSEKGVNKAKAAPSKTKKVAVSGLKWLRKQKEEVNKCGEEWNKFLAQI